jgi:hypothetical protein
MSTITIVDAAIFCAVLALIGIGAVVAGLLWQFTHRRGSTGGGPRANGRHDPSSKPS